MKNLKDYFKEIGVFKLLKIDENASSYPSNLFLNERFDEKLLVEAFLYMPKIFDGVSFFTVCAIEENFVSVARTTVESILREFIKSYLDLENAPTVYIMIPPRVYVEQDGGNCDDATVGGELADAVNQLGEELSLEVIDLYTLTTDHPEWFPDGLHPNAEGNRAIAEHIASYLK